MPIYPELFILIRDFCVYFSDDDLPSEHVEIINAHI